MSDALPTLYTLLALICGWNDANGRFDRDCKPPHVELGLSHDQCEARAVELRATSPAGVRVVAHACVNRERQLANARSNNR